MRIVLILLLVTMEVVFSQSQFSEISSLPGGFSRMGFGARGKAMGNAMTAITTGNLVSYYNPALSVFQSGNSFQTSYSFLSLDRNLNFLSFTRKFEFGKKNKDGTEREKPRGVAGISVGIINASVGDFPERDNQGTITGSLSPFENQFFMGLALKISEKLAIGTSAKFYYSALYEDISSTSLGFDIGILYKTDIGLVFAATLTDLNSKYEWDTSDLYGQEGTNTVDKFPLLKKFAVSYAMNNEKIIFALEIESSNAETNYLRFGTEYHINPNLVIRGGMDTFNLSNVDIPIRPSFGFSYNYNFGNFIGGIDYAFVIEPYSLYDQHIVGLSFNL
ncbi:hypothetical protein ACFLS9_02010 [Bacteroidota bacterium]